MWNHSTSEQSLLHSRSEREELEKRKKEVGNWSRTGSAQESEMHEMLLFQIETSIT